MMDYTAVVIAVLGSVAWFFVARTGKRSAENNAAAPACVIEAAPGAAARLQIEHLYTLGLDALRGNQFEQAAHILALAAQRGHTRALLHYGVLCEHGIGVPADLERARGLYEQACAQGDVDARFRLQVVNAMVG
jgi:TPR repeat protein